MNKIITKKTARVLSVLLAVLIVVNVMPGGMDRVLTARAEADTDTVTETETAVVEKEAEYLSAYTVALVDKDSRPLPIANVNVTMTLKEDSNADTEKSNDKNDGVKIIINDVYRVVSAKTDENGEAVFLNNIIPEQRYDVSFNTDEVVGRCCADIDPVTDLHIENIDDNGNSGNKLMVSVPDDKLNAIEYTVKVKNNTDYVDYGEYNMKLEYWAAAESEDGENGKIQSVGLTDTNVKDGILRFRFSGLIGKTYGIQVTGEPFVPVGTASVEFRGQTEKPDGCDLELSGEDGIKKFNVSFDEEQLINGYVVDVTEDYKGMTEAEIQNAVRERTFTKDEAIDYEEYDGIFGYDTSVKYVIVANPGYRISNCLINNDTSIETGQTQKYCLSLNNLRENKRISAVIDKKTYNVTFDVDKYGDVTLNGRSEELDNLGGTIEITSESENKKVGVDETSDITIKAAAKQNYSEDGGDEVIRSYHIKSFKYYETEIDSEGKSKKKGEEADVLKDNQPSKQNEPKELETTITDVKSNYHVVVQFTIDEYILEREESEFGEVSFTGTPLPDDNGKTKVSVGDNSRVTVKPKTGWHIGKIFVERIDDGSDPTEIYLLDDELKDNRDGTYQFMIRDIRTNIKVSVEYAEDETVGMNHIQITRPYSKDESNDEYVRYTYRKNDNNEIDDVYISFRMRNDSGEEGSIKGTCISSSGEEESLPESEVYANGNYYEIKSQIKHSSRVTSVQIYYDKQWHKVNLTNSANKKSDIILILDTDSPVKKDKLQKVPNDKWTNKKFVTFTGSLDMTNENEYTSSIDFLVYSKDKMLTPAEIRSIQVGNYNSIDKEFNIIHAKRELEDEVNKTAQNDVNELDKGKIEFTVSGQQNSKYYVYVVDRAGNILNFGNSQVSIDNELPTIDYFEVQSRDKSGNPVTFDEFGAAASDVITVSVSALDQNSGIQNITLYTYNKKDGSRQSVLATKANPESTSMNYTAEFQIPKGSYVSIAAAAEDRAGNKITVPVAMTQDNSNSYNGDILVDNDAARSIRRDVDQSRIDYKEQSSGKDWYNDIDKQNDKGIELTYSAQDQAGFRKVEVNLITYDENARALPKHNVESLTEEFANTYSLEADVRSPAYRLDTLKDTRQTSIEKTFNIQDVCEETGVTLNQGRNTLEFITYSRVQKGSDEGSYITTVDTYDFYIDKIDPVIKNITFEKAETAVDKVLNILTFGIYSNGDLKIEVEIDDFEITSGFKKVELYKGNEMFKESSRFVTRSDAQGKTFVYFEIPNDDSGRRVTDNDNEVYFNHIITAKVTDNVNNSSDNVTPREVIEDSTNNQVMIENIKPTISITVPEERYEQRNPNTYDESKIWFNKNITFTVDVSDHESRIKSVAAEINGTAIKGENGSDYLYDSANPDNTNLINVKENFSDSTLVKTNADGVVMNNDGMYALNVNAGDNAGNQAVQASYTFYKDVHAPTITRFEFISDDGRTGDGAPNSIVEMTDYGYYFKEETRIRVYTDDIHSSGEVVPSSGVNTIHFKAVPVAREGTSQVQSGVNIEEVGKVGSDGTYVFTVPANFKGQVFAFADDNVGNSTNRYVTPTGTITESAEQHEQEDHISIVRTVEAPSRTASGSPLYAGDVDVEFTIIDTYSGIQSAEVTINSRTYSVDIDNAKNDSDTIDDWRIAERDYNLVTKLTRVITVSDNMNDIPIKVTMTDRSGNTSESESSFSIDKTAPTLKVEFADGVTPVEGCKAYNRARTATITVTERNFSQKNFVPTIKNTDGVIPTVGGWTSSGSGDSATHVARITFAADGDYEFSAYCVDDVGNKSGDAGTEPFTIDLTKPVISISYDNNNANNGNYFSAERTATIEINEHNFEPNRVEIKSSADDNGKEVSFPDISGWSDSGNRHIATIKFSSDARYTFSVSVTDSAGNADSSGDNSFYIDKSKPKIEFSGVADKSANKDVVAPVISVTDKNFTASKVEIKLEGCNNGNVDSVFKKEPENLGMTGRRYTYENFPSVRENDDLYTLTVNASDLAGNKVSAALHFSANRFGSVYTLDESVKEHMNQYESDSFDVILKETNVDEIRNVKIKVSRDGTPNDIKQGNDYDVKEDGGDGSWKVNTYTIKSTVFDNDGKYIVSASSVDKAKNNNQNYVEEYEQDERSETKSELENPLIQFSIDKSQPKIVALNFEDDPTHAITENRFTAMVSISDNTILDSVEVKVDDVKVDLVPVIYGSDTSSRDEEEQPENTTDNFENGDYQFVINQKQEPQHIVITAVDKAGNPREENFDVLVSTNKFAIFLHTPSFVAGMIIVGVILIGGIVFLILSLRKKKNA